MWPSAESRSCRALKDLAFILSAMEGHHGEESKQTSDMIWVICLKNILASLWKISLKLNQVHGQNTLQVWETRQWKLLDTCCYYCLCLRQQNGMPAVLKSSCLWAMFGWITLAHPTEWPPNVRKRPHMTFSATRQNSLWVHSTHFST